MASMKSVKPQGSSPAEAEPPKVQQAKAGAAKPAPKKVVQKPQEPKKVLFLNKHPIYASYFLCWVLCNKIVYMFGKISELILTTNDAGDGLQGSRTHQVSCLQWIVFKRHGAVAAPYVLMK